MSETKQLNHGWLYNLSNPHHDGTTQQIDDFLQSFVSDNQVFNQKKASVHQCRQNEDEVWIKSQRDPAVKNLENADKRQDSYELAGRHILAAHAQLPDDEPTKAEAEVCQQIIKDAKFRTNESYDAEADKIIQIHQNLQSHEAFLTQIGAWTFFTKSLAAAQQVRELLGERALTKGEFVKGEMKKVRHATDLAIADMYKTIMAMLDLMPTAELTALYTQLKGIELYARQYYLKEGSSSGSGGSGGGDNVNGNDNVNDNVNGNDNVNDNGGGGDNGGSGDNGGGGGIDDLGDMG